MLRHIQQVETNIFADKKKSSLAQVTSKPLEQHLNVLGEQTKSINRMEET